MDIPLYTSRPRCLALIHALGLLIVSSCCPHYYPHALQMPLGCHLPSCIGFSLLVTLAVDSIGPLALVWPFQSQTFVSPWSPLLGSDSGPLSLKPSLLHPAGSGSGLTVPFTPASGQGQPSVLLRHPYGVLSAPCSNIQSSSPN